MPRKGTRHVDPDRGARFRNLRAKLGLSQDLIGDLFGVSARTWRAYEAGTDIPEGAVLLAIALQGWNISYLLTGVGELISTGPLSSRVLIPRYDVRPAAGVGGALSDPDEPSEFLALDRDWIRRVLGCRPESVVLVTAGGDSMYPTIADRDPLLVDTSDRDFRQNAIYVFRITDAIQVKRIQRKLTGGLALISDNALYPPETLSDEQAGALEIIGRVVWHGHKL